MKRLLLCCLLLIPAAATAQSLPPLYEDKRVRASFYAAGMADYVRNNCPDLEGRMMRGLRYALALRNYALGLGYTMDDVERLLANKTEENKMRRIILRDLEARGATSGNTEAFCRVGREEISRNTLAGRLLRDRG